MVSPTSIKLDDELKGRVQELADARQRSAHWVMREAIEQYVEREEKSEAFKRDALRAWEEYQATGRHVPAHEVENWLAGWGTEHEAQPPKCRK